MKDVDLFKLLLIGCLLCYVCSSYHAPAQTMSQSQLERLETIYQSYKANSQKAELKQKELQEQVQDLKEQVTVLQNSQKKERELITSLNCSLRNYEEKVSQNEAKILEQSEVINQQKLKLKNRASAILVLCVILALFILIAVLFIFLRIKKVIHF